MHLTLAALALLPWAPQQSPAVSAALSGNGPLQLGSTTSLELSAPTFPGRPYLAAASLAPVPGIPTDAGLIALAPDSLFFDTLGADGFAGLLDPLGAAPIPIAVPADPALEGLAISTAAIVLGPGGIDAISNTLPRRIRALPPTYDFAEIDALLESFSDGWFLNDGVAFAFVQNGTLVHLATFGDIDVGTRVPFASATKWFAAAAFETLVDSGALGLDTPLAEELAAFGGDKALITYRQAYSHTSGLPAQWPCLGDTDSTLQACAQAIATATLVSDPGSTFAYGGVSMHAAGAAIENLVGQPYETWFQGALADPLGATTFAHDGFGPTLNPRVAGGGQGTVLDYVPLLKAILDGGAVDGRPVLSTRAVLELTAEQTGGAPVLSTPLPEALGYGLGCWVEALGKDGRPSILSSPGAFGAYPWVDLERGYGAFVLVDRGLGDARAIVEAVRPLCERQAEDG